MANEVATKGEIVGAFVLPHGGIAFDPTYFNSLPTTDERAKQDALQLHKQSQSVGEAISNLKPDLILLSTPHGISDVENFVLYLGAKGYGSADTDNYKGPYRLSVDFDSVSCQSLLDKLHKEGENVSALQAFSGAEPFPLRWGEVIPLSFIPNLETMKTVIISHPRRRNADSVKMIPELVHLGAMLHKHVLSLGKRVVVVISGDLAHTFEKDGPYGFSPAAEPFDKACGQWATSLDEDALLSTAAKYVNEALSCGYTGLVMLHGLLKEASLESWIPTVHANLHPSYYGMMVASFLRK